MHVLVTGGAGFIGSTLVDRLLGDGHSVDVVDDLSAGSLANLEEAASSAGGAFNFTQLDVRSDALLAHLEERRPEVVMHLAAQISVARSIESPHLDADVNLLGTLRVLDAARAGGTRKVLFAASAAVYGNVDESELPITETRPFRPSSPYGLSKATAMRYLAAYGELFGLSWTTLILANVYGRRQRADGEGGVVARFAAGLAAAQGAEIHGDGTQRRDFVHVEDVADAFVRAMDAGDRRVLNIGSSTSISINELYAVMANAVGSTASPRRTPARTGDVRSSCLDASAAFEELGWAPKIPLDVGLRNLLDSRG